MDHSLESLKGLFLDESSDQVATLDAFIRRGEADVDAAFRAAHALKGAAATMGYSALAEAAHLLEDELQAVRQNVQGPANLVPALDHLVLRLQELTHSAGVHEFTLTLDPACPMPSVRAQLILAALAKTGEVVLCEPNVDQVTRTMRVGVRSTQSREELEAILDRLPEVSLARSDQQAQTPVATERRTTARVPIERIDDIVRIAGELYNERKRLSQLAQELGDGEATRPLRNSVDRVCRLVASLQETAIRSRLMPLSGLLRRFPKLAADLARQLSKTVELQVHGGDIEVDRATLDGLSDPLLHLIRNAVDHGIELPHERSRLGKPAHGTITISVLQLGNAVCIQVADDGRGIDPNQVAASAVGKGLITAEEAAQLSLPEALNLITTPGFSTASEVTSVSGRGVGMDIVREAVLGLGGRLEITSDLGAGTTFSLVVPQSMAVLPCLIVRSGGTLWAIPTMHLCETSLATGAPSVAERLGLPPDERPKFAFTISHPGASIRTLSVQSLLGEESLVVKPMSALAGAHPAVQGAALLPNGEPILILDPLSL